MKEEIDEEQNNKMMCCGKINHPHLLCDDRHHNRKLIPL
jgi:hypothetical protein